MPVTPAGSRNQETKTLCWVKGSSPTDCLQPLYGAANRLTKVTVAAYAGTSWQTLRTYELEQTTRTFNYTGFPTQRRLLLTGLVQRGKDGAAALGRYDFAYNAIGEQLWRALRGRARTQRRPLLPATIQRATALGEFQSTNGKTHGQIFGYATSSPWAANVSVTYAYYIGPFRLP